MVECSSGKLESHCKTKGKKPWLELLSNYIEGKNCVWMKQNVSVHFVRAMKNVNCTHLRKMAAVESILFSKPLEEALGNSPQNSQMKCNIVLKNNQNSFYF